MRVLWLCVVMGLLMSGCATTKKVDLMIGAEVNPRFKQIDAQFDAQKAADDQLLKDMKSFIDRLGRTLDADVKEIQSGVESLKGQVGALETDTAVTEKDMSVLKATSAKLDESINSLKGKVASLNVADPVGGKVTLLNSTVDSLKETVKNLEESNRAIAERLDKSWFVK